MTKKYFLVTVTLGDNTRLVNERGFADDLQVVVERFGEVWSRGPVPAVHVQELEPGAQVRIEGK